MVQSDPLLRLPTSEELSCSDDTPVDNEIQNLIPNLLLTVLSFVWNNRQDWFLGVDMGVYYLYQQVRQPVIVPDGFLSIGVPRYKGERGRLSYVLWEENNIPPIWVLEIVSQTPGGEYHEKMTRYAQLGVLYYTIYNPEYWRRDKHNPFENYRLVEGEYIQQTGEPFWMPEVGLSIGRENGTYERWTREWLYWYDQNGTRLSSPEEIVQQERQRAEQQRQRAEQERQRAEQQRQRAEQQRQRAEQAELQLEQQRQQIQQNQKEAIARLLSLGLDVEQIAAALNLSVQIVQQAIDD